MADKSKSGKDNSFEDIITAADKGQLDVVTALLEEGIDPNTVDEVGDTALHNAAKKGHWDIARILLERSASPLSRNGNDSLPLHLAIRAGHTQVVRLLLECDPSTYNCKEGGPYEPIHIAAVKGHAEIVQLLIDYNASTLSTPKDHATALHLAAHKGHYDVCEILVKHDKKLDRSLWERLTGPSLEVYARDYTKNTPLSHAVFIKNKQIAELILRHHPDLSNSLDAHKELLFHRVIRLGNVGMAEVFLNNGTDIEMKDNYGRGALHVAVAARPISRFPDDTTPEMIRFLLARGAMADAKTKDGYKPEDLTREPKIKVMLRNSAKPQSLGQPGPLAATNSIPPPEYKP
ncbi:hypothetical protein N7494_005959 [Penicillium frequentans]|uniref:Uncharacterized protein n=1 Tax=Penicillium frequentans TaxID=3151616 RepID=A0AAD6CXR1_9EURO|nr:hypothetical protein N7494_005959 [Penicillium glabrum]